MRGEPPRLILRQRSLQILLARRFENQLLRELLGKQQIERGPDRNVDLVEVAFKRSSAA